MTTPRVVGIDPATKNLGYAHADGTLRTLNARAGADDPIRRLDMLERAVMHELAVRPPRPDLVVIEGYALGSPGRLGLVRMGEVGAICRLAAFRVAAYVVEVQPSALKRYATGNGAADKPAMVEAARELGAETTSHDEADAFLLRHIGRAAYGLELVLHAHRREVLASIRWPKL